MILKSIGKYYRNKFIRKGIMGTLKGGAKTFAAVMAIALVLDTAGVNLKPTAIALEFKEKAATKIEEIKEDACNLFSNEIASIVTNGDYSSEDGIQDLSNDIANASETFANENGVEFQRASVSRVVDGDTIVIDICGGNCGNKDHEYTVRLIGVNTPESVAPKEYLEYKGTENSAEGKAASEWLADYLEDEDYVYLESDVGDTDKYGRLLRYVWLDVPSDELDINVISTDMLNAILLEKGYAEVATYKPNVKYADYFAAIEADLTDDFANDR